MYVQFTSCVYWDVNQMSYHNLLKNFYSQHVYDNMFLYVTINQLTVTHITVNRTKVSNH